MRTRHDPRLRERRASGRLDERGSVLFIALLVTTLFSFLLTFFLQQSTVRAKSARTRMESISALYTAFGELEKARTAISSSGYTGGHNNALQEALESDGSKISETDVVVTPLGDSGTWYTLTVTVPYDDVYERVISQPVREINYFSSYNLFVADDAAGISGAPVGNIHTNDRLLFYFPDGDYKYALTAVNGFEYVESSGATPENTRITGSYDPDAERIDIDFEGDERFSLSALEANVDPKFYFDFNAKLKLYVSGKRQWLQVQNLDRPKKTKATTVEPVYEWVDDTSKPKVKKTGYKTEKYKEWVEIDSGGTTVAGESQAADGYWVTKKRKTPYTYWEYPQKKVKVGEKKVTKTTTSYPTEKMEVPQDTAIFVTGDVQEIRGDVIGRVTIASGGDIRIRHNIRYRDEKNRTAYLYGTNQTKPYTPNPKYEGDATLGLIARRDIVYARNVPSVLEVNASMVAVTGRVGLEGLQFDADGNITGIARSFTKNSIRRLGGITSARRPVETWVKNGKVKSGFRSGASVFDIGVIGHPPPFFLSMPEPTFFATTILK